MVCDAHRNLFVIVLIFSDLGFGKLALHLRQMITKTCDEFANWNKNTYEEIQDVYVEGNIGAVNLVIFQTK